jgi:predicted ATPase with chaperone activity
MIQRYVSKISGPLLDRIDIHIEVPAVKYADLAAKPPGEGSLEIRERVTAARKIQQERFKDQKIHSNAQMTPRLIRQQRDRQAVTSSGTKVGDVKMNSNDSMPSSSAFKASNA